MNKEKRISNLKEIVQKIIKSMIIVWVKTAGSIAGFCRKIIKTLKSLCETKGFAVFAKTLLVLFVITAVVQFAAGVMIYGFKSESTPVKKVASILPYPLAVANQDFVTYGEYQKEKDYIHHFYNATKQSDVDFKQIDSQIMDQLIDNKIIAVQAILTHNTVSRQDIDTAINGIIDQNGGPDNVTKVLNDLYGLSLNDFRSLVKVQLTRDKINSKVIERVSASHILIKVATDAPADQVDAAKVKITGILDQIKGGLDFGDAAKKYSEDTASADQGGKLDPFARGEMVPEFSDAAFSTKVGAISDPVRSEYGWHIIKVESRTGSVDKTFTDWLAGIRKKSLIVNFYKI